MYAPRRLDVNIALPLVREAELSPLPFLPVGRLSGAAGLLTPPVPDIHHAGKLVPRAETRLQERGVQPKRRQLEAIGAARHCPLCQQYPHLLQCLNLIPGRQKTLGE